MRLLGVGVYQIFAHLALDPTAPGWKMRFSKNGKTPFGGDTPKDKSARKISRCQPPAFPNLLSHSTTMTLRPGSQSVIQPASQPVSQSTSHPAIQSCSHPVIQSVTQLVIQPVSQLTRG